MGGPRLPLLLALGGGGGGKRGSSKRDQGHGKGETKGMNFEGINATLQGISPCLLECRGEVDCSNC